jgi:hypothetical protein
MFFLSLLEVTRTIVREEKKRSVDHCIDRIT